MPPLTGKTRSRFQDGPGAGRMLFTASTSLELYTNKADLCNKQRIRRRFTCKGSSMSGARRGARRGARAGTRGGATARRGGWERRWRGARKEHNRRSRGVWDCGIDVDHMPRKLLWIKSTPEKTKASGFDRHNMTQQLWLQPCHRLEQLMKCVDRHFNPFHDIIWFKIWSHSFLVIFFSPHSATVQGETPWNPEILSREPNLNDSGAFYACGALLGFSFNMFCYGFQRNSELAAWHQDFS